MTAELAEVPTEGISEDILAALLADLKKMAPAMTAFRYEMFARRIVAAEYGRSDAVEWAMEWWAELEAAKNEHSAAAEVCMQELQAMRKRMHDDFVAGIVENPRYQAFLDTVENPAELKSNAPYMAWLSKVLALYAANKPKGAAAKDGEVEGASAFIRRYADANLSQRVRKARLRLVPPKN
jgi:hypothetical protein